MQELDLHDILSFDPNFGKILLELQMLVVRKKYIDANLTSDMKVDVDLHFHGMSIEDLCFDFTLPGYSNYILDQGKENTMVYAHMYIIFFHLITQPSFSIFHQVKMNLNMFLCYSAR